MLCVCKAAHPVGPRAPPLLAGETAGRLQRGAGHRKAALRRAAGDHLLPGLSSWGLSTTSKHRPRVFQDPIKHLPDTSQKTRAISESLGRTGSISFLNNTLGHPQPLKHHHQVALHTPPLLDQTRGWAVEISAEWAT